MKKFLHGKRHFYANTDNRNRGREKKFGRKWGDVDKALRRIWLQLPRKISADFVIY